MSDVAVALLWAAVSLVLGVSWRESFKPDRTSGVLCWVAAVMCVAVIVSVIGALTGRLRR